MNWPARSTARCPTLLWKKIQNALNDHTKPLKGSRVHICGVSYKRDIDDVRESPALDIMLLLLRRGSLISYTDSHVPSLRLDELELQSTDSWEEADCVVIVTDHTQFDYAALVRKAKLIVDTRNALKTFTSEKIVRL